MSAKRSTSSTPNKISACLVVYNDGRQIARCLESIRDVVDEIIITHDGPCTDSTLEIAKQYGAKTFVGKHFGYPEPHRVTGFRKATGNWILVIDADEYLSPKLRKNLRGLVDSGQADGYMFLWRFWDGKKYITKSWPYRIGVVKKSSLHFLATLHPDWTIRGKSINVDYQLEHKPNYNNVTWQSFRTKWMQWLKLHARQVVTNVEDIPRFQYSESKKPGHIEWIARYDLLVAPFIFLYFFAATMKLSFPTEGLALTKYAFFQALYYFVLCWEVFLLKKTASTRRQ